MRRLPQTGGLRSRYFGQRHRVKPAPDRKLVRGATVNRFGAAGTGASRSPVSAGSANPCDWKIRSAPRTISLVEAAWLARFKICLTARTDLELPSGITCHQLAA